MILKFDHISFSCKNEDAGKVMKSLDGYELVFCEEKLHNMNSKKNIMKQVQAFHNISLMHSSAGLPIEITSYNFCESSNDYLMLDGCIIKLFSPKIEYSIQLFRHLGFKIEEKAPSVYLAELKPLLDKEPVTILIQEREIQRPYLDSNGFSSLAFIVDNLEKEKEKLSRLHYNTTEIECLCVNKKQLKIFFLEGISGEIFEFIALK